MSKRDLDIVGAEQLGAKGKNAKLTRRQFGLASAGMLAGAALLGRTAAAHNGREVWWLGADPHVAYLGREGGAYDRHLERCAEDVNMLGMADYAAVLGDLGGADLLEGADRIQSDEDASRFHEAMEKFEVNEWHYVTGNHEFVDDELVIPAKYWAQDVLGVRFIFMSDEKPGYAAGMSDEQAAWFFDELEAHADQPVFIFSHQPPDRSGPWDIWERLQDRLDEFSIKAWFHAHEHRWSVDEMTEYGFARVSLGAIYEYTENPAYCGHYNGAFLMLSRKHDRTNVRVWFRNHDEQRWITADGYGELAFSVEV